VAALARERHAILKNYCERALSGTSDGREHSDIARQSFYGVNVVLETIVVVTYPEVGCSQRAGRLKKKLPSYVMIK